MVGANAVAAGGLRGAVADALNASLNVNPVPPKRKAGRREENICSAVSRGMQRHCIFSKLVVAQWKPLHRRN